MSREQIATVTAAGIPVMAHIGFTPQSVNSLGGFRVQGRGDGADQLVADAIAVQEAGAFSVVMEMVPAEIAGQVTRKLTIPTVGIGAGAECDAQVLVWQDMAGYTSGQAPRSSSRSSARSATTFATPPPSMPTRFAAARSRAPSTGSDPTPPIPRRRDPTPPDPHRLIPRRPPGRARGANGRLDVSDFLRFERPACVECSCRAP